jgi:hypothetical protein
VEDYTVPQNTGQSPLSTVIILIESDAACEILIHKAKYTKPRFDPSPVHVGFLVDKVALERIILREYLFRFSPVSIITSLLPTPISFMYH